MMKKIKGLVGTMFMLVLLTLSIQATAQKAKPIKIAMLARPLKDSILLRWGPSNAQAWHSLNKTGYQLRRFTILRDGRLLAKPEQILLSAQPIKPWPMEAWQQKVEADDKYFSIAAQALYGESFEVSQSDENAVS